MKDTVNAYAAALLITIAGAAATWLIVHVAFDNAFATTTMGSEGSYTDLENSILNQ